MKLNKIQSYAIQYLLSQSRTPLDISTELKLPLETVQKYVEKHQIASTDNNIPATTSKVTASDLKIRHTRDTKEASEVTDAARTNTTPKQDPNHIYKPR